MSSQQNVKKIKKWYFIFIAIANFYKIKKNYYSKIFYQKIDTIWNISYNWYISYQFLKIIKMGSE